MDLKLRMIRQMDNILIMQILESYLRENPDMRFNQALYNLGIITMDNDSYSDEPGEVLARITNK